ncbi:hypothetical protein LX36DRAFT_654810 [Colletotrichum falcatum]|nr:hypothetical protein LX36DRAFT_654810 [Colletotrichum falcatum]
MSFTNTYLWQFLFFLLFFVRLRIRESSRCNSGTVSCIANRACVSHSPGLRAVAVDVAAAGTKVTGDL